MEKLEEGLAQCYLILAREIAINFWYSRTPSSFQSILILSFFTLVSTTRLASGGRFRSIGNDAVRQYNIMVRVNQWAIVFTDNIMESFWAILAMEEEDINFTVKISISNNVVISWVVEGDSFEGKGSTKVIGCSSHLLSESGRPQGACCVHLWCDLEAPQGMSWTGPLCHWWGGKGLSGWRGRFQGDYAKLMKNMQSMREWAWWKEKDNTLTLPWCPRVLEPCPGGGRAHTGLHSELRWHSNFERMAGEVEGDRIDEALVRR